MLHLIKPAPGSRKKRKRVGRGNAAGGGTTAGRGTKGQQARSGSKQNAALEGGQKSFFRQQPKLGGFKNPNRKEYEPLNISTLEAVLDAGTYDLTALRERNLIGMTKRVKLLARGEVKKKFNITVHAASKSAIKMIEEAGGTVTIAA
jgi:large subunit ribosomal protein L15